MWNVTTDDVFMDGALVHTIARLVVALRLHVARSQEINAHNHNRVCVRRVRLRRARPSENYFGKWQCGAPARNDDETIATAKQSPPLRPPLECLESEAPKKVTRRDATGRSTLD